MSSIDVKRINNDNNNVNVNININTINSLIYIPKSIQESIISFLDFKEIIENILALNHYFAKFSSTIPIQYPIILPKHINWNKIFGLLYRFRAEVIHFEHLANYSSDDLITQKQICYGFEPLLSLKDSSQWPNWNISSITWNSHDTPPEVFWSFLKVLPKLKTLSLLSYVPPKPYFLPSDLKLSSLESLTLDNISGDLSHEKFPRLKELYIGQHELKSLTNFQNLRHLYIYHEIAPQTQQAWWDVNKFEALVNNHPYHLIIDEGLNFNLGQIYDVDYAREFNIILKLGLCESIILYAEACRFDHGHHSRRDEIIFINPKGNLNNKCNIKRLVIQTCKKCKQEAIDDWGVIALRKWYKILLTCLQQYNFIKL